jgi:hypothetical protein
MAQILLSAMHSDIQRHHNMDAMSLQRKSGRQDGY